ncbi:hypothetical protein PPYR_13183 [Photinus pyralis]|uniref:E3 ubiquitin-protein ligase n=3 Tax=Photinus pyralis TaxID=7054 RepID=A0A5N4A8B2_PHOPY|nr:E3 ubiquitin-protein ligase SIAH1-like isoform X2 [Photinus pyralis]KAB0793563.1 hypothetical protein PPYR_13183 [Photinus pyralis]
MNTGNLFCCNCLQLVSPPIKQCSNKHSICGKCQPKGETSICPKCANRLYAVSYDELEKVIAQLNKEKVTFPCAYESKGCSYKIEQAQKLLHESECKFRSFQCEGKKYCGWKCDWVGKYDQLLDHFRNHHDCGMNYKVDRALKINFAVDSTSLEPIDYYDGCALFWYKQKVDVSLQMVYWVIQYVGLQKDACQYFYEFEIHDGPIRKIKITEFCESDSMDANSILKSGQCVALPFSAVKSFLSVEGYLYFRFRVMKVKKPSTANNDEENAELKNLVAQMRINCPPMHPRRTNHDAQNCPQKNPFGKKRSNK